MNIVMLTTWNSNCGIAEYSRNLVKEFLEMKEVHNVLLLTNKPADTLDIHPRRMVVPVFGVHWWGENPRFYQNEAWDAMCMFEAKHGPIDVLFVQYQSSLYEPEGFNLFLKGVKCPVIMLQHDSSKNDKHDFSRISKIMAHNDELSHDYFIQFPTVEKPASVFSFGMGRNDYNFIKMVCDSIGLQFNSHDSRKDGWLSEDELFDRMKDADAIVLWYNDVPIKGQSAALRTAIASHRPVIVNDIDWFKDAPFSVVKVPFHRRTDKDKAVSLAIALTRALNLGYIKSHSYRKCAERYLEIANG